jgi:hypothetical protein
MKYVSVRLNFNSNSQITFQMSRLGTEKRVTDLNSAAAFPRISDHELRTLHFLPGSRPGPPPDARPHGQAIRAHYLCPPFGIPTATHLHGFRADDFQGRVARHRSLPQRKDRDRGLILHEPQMLSNLWHHRAGDSSPLKRLRAASRPPSADRRRCRGRSDRRC